MSSSQLTSRFVEWPLLDVSVGEVSGALSKTGLAFYVLSWPELRHVACINSTQILHLKIRLSHPSLLVISMMRKGGALPSEIYQRYGLCVVSDASHEVPGSIESTRLRRATSSFDGDCERGPR